MKWSNDTLKCWSTDNCIRFVGEAKDTIYPMEGIRSNRDVIAMSYWSEGTISICGTVMVQSNLVGSTYIGTRSGHTVRSLQTGLLEFVCGNVFITISEEESDQWYEKRIAPKSN